MKNFAIALILVLSLSACLPMGDERALRALKAQGFTDITLTGMSVFGCSDDDIFRSNFTAKGASGAHVQGTVCGGIFKGTTIRTD